MVYLFGVDALVATTYSLFVVGSTSVIGSVAYFRKGLVNFKTVLFFGLPSIASVLLTRSLLVPAIPTHIISIGGFELTKSILFMLLFSVLMIVASFSMIRKQQEGAISAEGGDAAVLPVLLQGLGVGVVTGLIGAGGGFLIIPALVNMLKLPMKNAVGTSLVIIAINSLSGFLMSVKDQAIQWPFLAIVAAIAMGGILIGSFLATKIDGKRLKPAFGWFVLIMGIYILIKETLL